MLLGKVADLAEDVAVRRLDAAGKKVRRHGEISSPSAPPSARRERRGSVPRLNPVPSIPHAAKSVQKAPTAPSCTPSGRLVRRLPFNPMNEAG